jgi:hypothetical protein
VNVAGLPQLPTLGQLAAEALDAAAFRAAHTAPALVFETADGSGGAGPVDTPSSPFAQGVGSSTEVLGPLAAAQQMTRMADLVDPLARVAFLEKSARNPFGGLITLGRARNNDLVLSVPSVSKLHAIFTHPDERWLLADDDSVNGTFLNGSRLPAKEKTPVGDGDSLRFGPDVQCRLFLPESLLGLLALVRGRA